MEGEAVEKEGGGRVKGKLPWRLGEGGGRPDKLRASVGLHKPRRGPVPKSTAVEPRQMLFLAAAKLRRSLSLSARPEPSVRPSNDRRRQERPHRHAQATPGDNPATRNTNGPERGWIQAAAEARGRQSSRRRWTFSPSARRQRCFL